MKKIEDQVWQALKTVIDPELNIDIVSLGLIYKVDVQSVSESSVDPKFHVDIVMTLTTPGCPLAGVFEPMVRSALVLVKEIDPEEDVSLELTFDPPWVQDMMSEEAQAEQGLI